MRAEIIFSRRRSERGFCSLSVEVLAPAMNQPASAESSPRSSSQSLLPRARAGVGAAGTAVALLTEALLACVWPRPASLGAVVTCPAGAARRNLARLGVALGLTQAEVDADLVPDHFGVVARRDGEHLPRPDLGLRAIIHDDPHPSRNRV